jgi:hypothetical protein
MALGLSGFGARRRLRLRRPIRRSPAQLQRGCGILQAAAKQGCAGIAASARSPDVCRTGDAYRAGFCL